MTKITCPECNGTGNATKYPIGCWKCDGKGTIEEPTTPSTARYQLEYDEEPITDETRGQFTRLPDTSDTPKDELWENPAAKHKDRDVFADDTATTQTESFEDSYSVWASQGRTEEQKWAVRNFLTGIGGIAHLADKQAYALEVLEGLKEKMEPSDFVKGSTNGRTGSSEVAVAMVKVAREHQDFIDQAIQKINQDLGREI